MAVSKRGAAATTGRRPDPAAGFVHPRPDAGTAPDDPLRAAKSAAVPRSEALGGEALVAARQFVQSTGTGRGARIASDTVVAQTAKAVAGIRGDAELSDAGKQARLGAVGVALQQQVTAVLAKIAAVREAEAPGPGPGEVRLGADAKLDSLLAYGTAGQVVAALDAASGDEEINDALWMGTALVGEGGRLEGSPRKLDVVGAQRRALVRWSNFHDWLARQLLANRLDAAEHAVKLAANELVRTGAVDVAYAATGTFRALDAPGDDPATYAAFFDAVHQAAINPGASPWVLQPDGSLARGGSLEGEVSGPARSMADDSYSQI